MKKISIFPYFQFAISVVVCEDLYPLKEEILRVVESRHDYATSNDIQTANVIISDDTGLLLESSPHAVRILICSDSTREAQKDVSGIILLTQEEILKHFRGVRQATE